MCCCFVIIRFYKGYIFLFKISEDVYVGCYVDGEGENVWNVCGLGYVSLKVWGCL